MYALKKILGAIFWFQYFKYCFNAQTILKILFPRSNFPIIQFHSKTGLIEIQKLICSISPFHLKRELAFPKVNLESKIPNKTTDRKTAAAKRINKFSLSYKSQMRKNFYFMIPHPNENRWDIINNMSFLVFPVGIQTNKFECEAEEPWTSKHFLWCYQKLLVFVV